MPLRLQLLEPRLALCCPCCGESLSSFSPIPEAYIRECEARGVEHPLEAWETLNLEAYICPSCGATDRDRLQVLFLSGFFARKHKSAWRVLEIAPSRPVSDWMRSKPYIHFRTADLEMASADDRVDVTDMSCYATGSFDIVLCSHVLEHVPDDLKAMREMKRIMAENGVAVLLVPISTAVEDVYEDPALTDEAARWRLFGQGDHVRIYGRAGFERRLAEAGFTVSRFCPEKALEYGLSQGSTLYLGAH